MDDAIATPGEQGRVAREVAGIRLHKDEIGAHLGIMRRRD